MQALIISQLLVHKQNVTASPSCHSNQMTRTSVPNDKCVMATSSTMMLNSLARCVRLSRTCRGAQTQVICCQPT